MWMSLTSVCANVVRLRHTNAARVRKQEHQERSVLGTARLCRSTALVGSRGITEKPIRTRASGRDDRRPSSRRAINTSMGRMLAQLAGECAEYLSIFGDNPQIRSTSSSSGKRASGALFRAYKLTCYNQRFPMADIRPFRALRYNLDMVTASQVVTQPYDKITPAMQKRYYAASPFNLVRIILGLREPGDNTTENVYTRAAAFGRQWRAEGILRQDSAPSIYAYSQAFTTPSGKRFERRGFIALGRVEDYAAKVVFRHEQTLAKPKADRLE